MGKSHTKGDLKQMQALPLYQKILLTKRRIKEWYDYWNGNVFVSFSGGKDSTVLKHIVDSMYDDVPALFVNTGLEYPEIQKFAMSQKNVITIRPQMRFDEVLKTYGYPVIGKKQADVIALARNNMKNGKYSLRLRSLGIKPDEAEEMGMELPDTDMLERYERTCEGSKYTMENYRFMLDVDFEVSNLCCYHMKKAPSFKFQKETGLKPMLATMAQESMIRESAWLRNGCNAFESKHPSSQPMSFWTEQDVLHYLKKYNVPFCSVYGDIVLTNADAMEGQCVLDDSIGDNTQLSLTGCSRTGCIFCGFGVRQEKCPNRFQRLKQTHPRQYEYCIGGGEYVDGKWMPNKQGLGMAHVLETIGVKY